jgi:hypothetical protein
LSPSLLQRTMRKNFIIRSKLKTFLLKQNPEKFSYLIRITTSVIKIEQNSNDFN